MFDKRANMLHLYAFAAIATLLVTVLHTEGYMPDYRGDQVVPVITYTISIVINWLCFLTMGTTFMTMRRVHKRAKRAKRAIEAGVPEADVIESLSSPAIYLIIGQYHRVREGYQNGDTMHPLVDIMLYTTMIYTFGVHYATGWFDIPIAIALSLAFLFDFTLRSEADEKPAIGYKATSRQEQTQ